MAKYIDKSALVAEIERWMTLFTKEKNQEGASKIDKLSLGGRIAELQEVKAFLDTLEVKEDVVSNDLLANSLEISRHGNSHNGGNGNLEEAASQYPSVICQISPQWKSEVENVFKAGAEWQKEQMIDKACEWLEEHLLDFWSQRITNTDYFIEEFKKQWRNRL